MNKRILDKLIGMNACDEGMEYVRSCRTMQEAWDKCERGDWMLWLLGRLAGPPKSKSRKKLVLAACACARLSLKYIPADEKRPLAVIETAEAWARGQDGVSLDDVRRAYASASDYAYASGHAAAASASDYAYATAASAAAYAAATSASDYAYATAATASAYAAAACADYAADYAYARKKTLLQCAEIVRSMYPKAPGLKGEQG